MSSRFRDKFNHDPWAATYDANVADEANPIRAAYAAVLNCVAKTACVTAKDIVVELGTGTGNLALKIGPSAHLYCVDVSEKMLDVARKKLEGRKVSYVQTDLLSCLESIPVKVDVVVSTYAIHHLQQDEKEILFQRVANALTPGGRAVFGDLMVEDVRAYAQLKERYLKEGKTDVACDMDDEFFWDISLCHVALLKCGFEVQWRRFSDLSWVVSLTRK